MTKDRASPMFRAFGNDASGHLSHNPNMAGKTKTESVNHLRAWRQHKRLTQTALADLANTKASVISELESGQMQLSDKWLRRLAPHLGTTPGFLLDHNPNDMDSAFIEAAMAVPPERREQALQILRTFRSGTGG